MNKSAVEVKQEVEMHLAEKEVIEGLLPSNIVIGPFCINTENVRQGLSKKRKALGSTTFPSKYLVIATCFADLYIVDDCFRSTTVSGKGHVNSAAVSGNAVLELLAKQLRKQAEDACEEFKTIARKLYEKPNCIEELSEIREWMKSIPETLKEHQELIDKAMTDYELIEEFYYNLSTDDFNLKYSCVGWPHKIELQMLQTEKQLEEDEERFHKLQLSDTGNFNDRLDGLSVSPRRRRRCRPTLAAGLSWL